ncbi:DUF5979 domain-containing protein [Cellulosimicrobium sp. NPDC057127]|uniref:DUF5979 domain-containing protein n=1 Tax=Cellulosimicrobium sp. NPDC057127 TaxID=3346026 RepID=UPI00363AE54F
MAHRRATGYGTTRAAQTRHRRHARRQRRGWAALGAAALALPLALVPAAPAAAASWGIQKTEVSVGPYEPGEDVQWAVTVSCSDPNADPCVPTTLTDPLPDGLELVTASIQSQGGATGGELVADTETDTVTYTADGVPNGDQVQILVTAQVDPDLPYSQDGVPITNTATVVSDNAAQQSASDAVTPEVPLVIGSSTTKEIEPPTAIASPGTAATITLGSTSTSNDPVDTLVVQDPVDPTADPSPFTYLTYAGTGEITYPPNADTVVEEYWDGDSWEPLDDSVDPAAVQGVRYTFSGDIQPGATASVPVDVVQSEAVTTLTGPTTVTNDASSYVTHAGVDPSTPTTASDTYVITPPNNSVTPTKTFSPATVSAGEPTTVTLGATNDGDPTTSLTITEPSPGTDSPFEGDDPLTFTGWGTDGAGAGVVWPADADAASVTFTCADGTTTDPIAATAPDTLPDPPAGCTVVGFSVEFTGDVVTGATATIPFTADTDADQAEDDVVHPNEITAVIPNDSATASADLTTLTDRLATVTTKSISPSEVPALPGQSVVVALPTQLLPFGPDGSTTGADQVVVQDPTDPAAPDEFWDDFTATAVRSTDVPGGTELTVNYWDGTAWVEAPGCGSPVEGAATVNCDLPDDAQGVQFVYDSTTEDGIPPGTSFAPNVVATYDGAEDRDAPYTNCGASSASSGTVPPTEPAEGCAVVDPFPVPTGPGELDLVAKDFLAPPGQEQEPYTLRARTQDTITAQITWSTNGFTGVDPMVISDTADPVAADDPAIAGSFYDAFDLTRVEAIDPSVDPLMVYDAVTGVELFVDGAWVDATGDPCSVDAPCTTSFPGYTLTADEQESATSVRLTYTESPTRAEFPADPTQPAQGDGVARSTLSDGRHLDLTFRLRDDKRSDGSPVLGVENGTLYNTDDPGLVNDTARATATFQGTDRTDTAADDVLILDTPINVGITKEWTGGPLSVPPEGTPDSAYPSTHVVVTGVNNSVARVDTVRIAEPSTANDGGVVAPETADGTRPFDAFTLTAVDIAPPEGTVTTTVTLTSVGGGVDTFTEAEAEALTPADLEDVVGVEVEFDGRVVSQGEGVLDLTLLLRELDRYTGERITVDDSPVPNSAGAEVADPGGTAEQSPQAWDTAAMELQDAAISLEQTKSFDPATIVEPGSDAETNPTSVLTITGRPTGPSRAVEMTLTDVDGSFWNQYDLVDLDGSALVTPIDQVQVDACTGGTYDEATDSFPDCTWTDGEPAGTFALPAGVDAADVTGLRFTFTREDGAIWENPANPTQPVALTVQVRDTLRSDPSTPVPSDLAENAPAPGEDAPGIATNDVTSTVTGADLVPDPDDPENPAPVTSEADATSSITYQHTENGVNIVKDFGGVVTGGTQSPDAVFPLNITVTNVGNRPVYDPVVVDDPMPSDADGPQLRRADGVEEVYSYALSDGERTPDVPNGTPMPTTDAGTADQVVVDADGNLSALTFTFPEGTVLEVDQSYTITVMVQFRVTLPANTVVQNTAGVTGDRPWDVCQTGPLDEPVDGRLDEESGACEADADVTPIPSAVLAQSKSVKATDDDELGLVVDPDAPGGADPEDCVPDESGFYAYPCAPVIVPGHDETWRIRVDNVGNLPLDKVVVYDRLPTPGDVSSYVQEGQEPSPRGSQWAPILTNDPPPQLVNAPAGSTTTFYYTTVDDYCMDDIGLPMTEPCSDDPAAGGWAELVPGTSDETYAQITAIKAVVVMAEDALFRPGQFIALEGTTTTPPEIPEAGDRALAWNSAAASGVALSQAGVRFELLPTEGVKVGVATASGPLEVDKAVIGEGAGYAPASFDLTVRCTSAVGTWVETVLDPIPVTVVPGTPVTVPDLPYGAECTLTEDAGAGQTALLVDPVTIDSETVDEDPTTIMAVNVYSLSSMELSKEVVTDAVDQDGEPVPFGPFEATVECTFLGEPVYADGYGPLDPMVVTIEDGETVELTGLPVNSECTVTETGTGNASSTTITVQHGQQEPVVTDGTSAGLTLASDVVGVPRNAVTLTNTYDVGVLDLLKIVDGEGAEAYGQGPFPIDVVCTFDDDGDGPGEPRTVYDSTVVLGGGGPLTAQVANLPAGAECDVTETDDAGATGAVVVPSTITVDADEPAQVVVTNTFDVGSVEVDKELAGLGALYGPGPFEVELACTYEDVALTIPGGGTRELVPGDPVLYDGLPVGSVCAVTETDTFGASSTTITVDGGELVEGTTVDDVVVPPADDGEPTTVTVTVTNTFLTAPLVVRKVVDGAGATFAPAMPDLPPLPEVPDGPVDPAELARLLQEVEDLLATVPFAELPYAVSIECTTALGTPVTTIPGGPERRFGPGVPAVYFGLQDGDECTVTETETGGATAVSVEPDPVVVDGTATLQEPVEVVVTNTFEAGQVVVRKILDGAGAGAHEDDTFVVALACTQDVDGVETPVVIPGGAERALSAADGWTAVYELVPQGATCALAETGSGDAESVEIVVDGASVRTDPADGVPTSPTFVVPAGDDARVDVAVMNTFAAEDVPPDTGGGGWLPRTGSTVVAATALAVLLLAAGAMLVALRRRTSP